MLRTKKVLLKIEDTIATVTMNRPEKLNALDRELWMGLEEAAKTIEREPTVRVAILTGAGRAFCAGLDIHVLASPKKCSLACHFAMHSKPCSILEGYSICTNLYLYR